MIAAMTGLNGLNGTSHGSPADDDTQEHRRLESEIAAAKARTAAARARAADLDAQVQADMRHELVGSRETVEEMERNHNVAIAMIRDAAQAEADRILEEARQLAAAVRGVRDVG